MERTEKTNFDIKIPEFLKSAETYQPNMPLAIDYCKLHQTTKKEGYRKLAIESAERAANTYKAYNIFAPNVKKVKKILKVFAESEPLGMDSEMLGKTINTLTNIKAVDMTALNEWRQHCTGCAKPVAECKNYRENMESFDKGVYEGMSEYVKKAVNSVSRIFSE
jgi:hypothetical protein